MTCADLRNAYFNGVPMDGLLLLRPPKGRLPVVGLSRYALACNLPARAIGHISSLLYKPLRRVAMTAGQRPSQVVRSL